MKKSISGNLRKMPFAMQYILPRGLGTTIRSISYIIWQGIYLQAYHMSKRPLLPLALKTNSW